MKDLSSMGAGWAWLLWAPLLEETVFRAGLHRAWLRRSPARSGFGVSHANLGVALAFGTAHALLRTGWIGLLTVPVALAIGGVFERTGRLRHCVLLHAGCNAVWLAGGSLGWIGN